jgi:hypothetical protein
MTWGPTVERQVQPFDDLRRPSNNLHNLDCDAAKSGIWPYHRGLSNVVSVRDLMSDSIKIMNGDVGWGLAARLLEAVWPPEVVATLPLKDVVWAHADSCGLNINGCNDVVGHAGIYLRNATFDARPV